MFQNKTETTILKNNDPKKKVLIVIAWYDNAVIAAWSDLAQQSYISTFYQCSACSKTMKRDLKRKNSDSFY